MHSIRLPTDRSILGNTKQDHYSGVMRESEFTPTLIQQFIFSLLICTMKQFENVLPGALRPRRSITDFRARAINNPDVYGARELNEFPIRGLTAAAKILQKLLFVKGFL